MSNLELSLVVSLTQLLASLVVITFSYMIWVQSNHEKRSEVENLIRSRLTGFSAQVETEANVEDVILNIDSVEVIENKNSKYRIKRIFNPYAEIEGRTKIHFSLDNLDHPITELTDDRTTTLVVETASPDTIEQKASSKWKEKFRNYQKSESK